MTDSPVTDIAIRGQTIDLDQLLKLAGIAGTGGHAKFIIQSGQVMVNGEPESRRRRTLRVGDRVTIGGEAAVRVVSETGGDADQAASMQ